MRPAIPQAVRAALIAGMATWFAGAAVAQPIRLIPPGGVQKDAPAGASQPQAAPTPPRQSAPSPANTAPPVEAAAPEDTPKIFVIEPLKAPDPSSAGLLDDGNGGLGGEMWDASPLPRALQVIDLLPAPVAAPALRDLQRRLLLTTAQVPRGEPGTPSLLGRRIAQLYRLGLVAEAEQLAVPKPAGLKDPIFVRLPVETALLRGNIAQACDLATQGLHADGDAYWQKVAVFCRYNARDIAGGDLALSLWRDSGGDDPAFATLAAAMRGDPRVKIESLGSGASPLHFAMLRAAGRPAPKAMLEIAPPALLPALAQYDKADAEIRLAAAEAAARYGVSPADRLAEAYASVQISEAERAAIVAGRGNASDKPARIAAALYQAARTAEEPKARLGALRRLSELAQERGLLFPSAAATMPLLVDLAPDAGSIAAAPAVIRLALAAGARDIAQRWYDTLLGMPPEQDKAGDLAAQAWPLMLLAGIEGGWRDSRYEAWVATQGSATPALRRARAALLLALVEGTGMAVPAERWGDLLAREPNDAREVSADRGEAIGTAPALAVWRNLLRATEVKAKAESVALVLALLGPRGTEIADGQNLATAMGALRNVGLDSDARRIALEAALLRGL